MLMKINMSQKDDMAFADDCKMSAYFLSSIEVYMHNHAPAVSFHKIESFFRCLLMTVFFYTQLIGYFSFKM